MFFAPPEVKAISRYSDFGSHLGIKTFAVTLLIATLLHVGFFGAYAMMPRHKVINIPVRALNIKLGADVLESAPQSEQPIADQSPLPPAPVIKNLAEEPGFKKKQPQVVMDRALTAKKMEEAKQTAADKKTAAKTPAVSVPKKYVRESPLDATQPKPSAQPQISGPPEEVVQRYTQTISLWVRQHQIYPQEAKNRNAQGEAMVRVRIDRQGHILYYVIEKSTGNAFLDHAAMSMVRASDPAPPVPENYPEGEVFEFLVPVFFKLEKN